MANKKYKLTDGNYWATDGIHDFGQNKTQREINADLVQADSDLSGAITSLGNANQYIIKQAGTYTTNGLVLAGYTTGSGNYFDFYIPISISSERTISSCSLKLTTVKLFLPDGVVDSAINTSTLNVMSRNDFGFMCEATLAATQTANRAASLLCAGITLVIT